MNFKVVKNSKEYNVAINSIEQNGDLKISIKANFYTIPAIKVMDELDLLLDKIVDVIIEEEKK